MAVTSLLAGGVTHDSATVVAEVGAGIICRLVYDTASDLSTATYSAENAADTDGYVRINISNLTPEETYHYAIETAGVIDVARGTFATHPIPGTVSSFTIAHASCEQGQGGPSTHRVFDAIRTRSPLMFMHLGDIHYKNITTANKAQYQLGIRQSITAARQVDMWRSLAMSYVWDDHDFGPDNSDSTAAGRTTVAGVYRQAIPHYDLPDSGAVYQAWTIGRVRFIQTDLRYYRTPDTATDDSSKTMLGVAQKAWFKNELLMAKDGALTVWLNSQVWCVDTPFSGLDSDGDHWGTFATERAEISNFLADNGITNVIQLTGDMHALGINTAIDYSTAQTAPMRIYAGSSLDSIPVARGHWDVVQTGRGQYGTLTVTDNGQRLTVLWQGWAVNDTTGAETPVMSDSFSRKAPVTGATYPVKVWNGTSWVERPVKRSTGSEWVRPTIKSA